MLREMLEMTRRLDDPADRTAGGRRPFAAGRSSPEGSWIWVSPDAAEARRAVPGPWSVTLLLRGRPAGGSTS